jgi:Tol biopolymer transport system component
MSHRTPLLLVAAFSLAAAAAAAQAELVSESHAGGATAAGLSYTPAISATGRFVAFASIAQDLLAPGIDTNLALDVYLADRRTGSMQRVSVDLTGGNPDADSWQPSVAIHGRAVAFLSDATDLVPGDDNGTTDAFVRDLRAGVTQRVSVGPGGLQADLSTTELSLSGSGRFVAFASSATNLLGPGGDTNGLPDVFVHDRALQQTWRVSVSSSGAQADAESRAPAISLDGRFVAFQSLASNLAGSGPPDVHDIFVHDLQRRLTVRASNTPDGGPLATHSFSPSISADGRRVAYLTAASDAVPGDLNGDEDIVVTDLRNGTNVLASVTWDGQQGDDSSMEPRISPDGRFVSFTSEAKNMGPVSYALIPKLAYLRDLSARTTSALAQPLPGLLLDGETRGTAIANGARAIAFQSLATSLTPDLDANAGDWDVFVVER